MTDTGATKLPTRRRRLLGVGLAAIVLLAAYVAWSTTAAFTLRSSIDIPAQPQQVWAVLANNAEYPSWNPFITASHGNLREGERLHNVLRDAHGDMMTFEPILLIVRPDHELRWIGHLGVPGIVDGEHRFVIEQGAPGVIRLTQQEDFRGILVPFLHGYFTSRIEPQFGAMNEALARRVADTASKR